MPSIDGASVARYLHCTAAVHTGLQRIYFIISLQARHPFTASHFSQSVFNPHEGVQHSDAPLWHCTGSHKRQELLRRPHACSSCSQSSLSPVSLDRLGLQEGKGEARLDGQVCGTWHENDAIQKASFSNRFGLQPRRTVHRTGCASASKFAHIRRCMQFFSFIASRKVGRSCERAEMTDRLYCT